MKPALLLVVTNHAAIDADHPTGVWLEEFAVPYMLFRQAGLAVTVASPRGGPAPIDPRSLDDAAKTEHAAAIDELASTRRLAEVDTKGFAAVFFPGGHGTMFDLPQNPDVARVVESFAASGSVVAAVCHGPACLVGARHPDGAPLVRGRRLTCFSNAEEREVQLDGLMPFLLESRLRQLGAEVVTQPNWSEHVVVDGELITGQNPQSSAATARAVIAALAG